MTFPPLLVFGCRVPAQKYGQKADKRRGGPGHAYHAGRYFDSHVSSIFERPEKWIQNRSEFNNVNNSIVQLIIMYKTV